jgi:hypothetical protein
MARDVQRYTRPADPYQVKLARQQRQHGLVQPWYACCFLHHCSSLHFEIGATAADDSLTDVFRITARSDQLSILIPCTPSLEGQPCRVICVAASRNCLACLRDETAAAWTPQQNRPTNSTSAIWTLRYANYRTQVAETVPAGTQRVRRRQECHANRAR